MRIRLNHKRLLEVLAASRLSQNHWAIRMGLSRGHWSQIVNGKHPYPSRKTRDLMLETLGCSFDELFVQESQPGVDADFQAAIADRYLLEKELGHGGMGTVYLTRDVKHGRMVALKLVSSEAVSGIGAEQFLREIRYAARMEHHNILPLYDSDQAAGHPFYVMPYVRGGSLRDRLDQRRPLPVEESVAILTGCAAALQHAHDRHVLHCDVKPENILLSGDHPYVADFGISRAIHAEAFEWGRRRELDSSAGTPAYVSPEQAAGEVNLRPASDVYSLACVAFEMLSGEQPFQGNTTMAVVSQRFRCSVPELRARAPHLPVALAATIKRAMVLEPNRRTPDAVSFARDVASTATATGGRAREAAGRAVSALWRGARKIIGFGGSTRRGRLLDTLWQDVRYAARSLKRAPAFSAAAVGTLALGIGATTAIFSVVNGVLFRPLDYPEPDRLVVMEFVPANATAQAEWEAFNDHMTNHARHSLTYPNFERWLAVTDDVLDELGVYDDNWTYNINFGGGTERLPGTIVSAGAFRALGVTAAAGRVFLDEDDAPGSPRTVILSHGLWQRRVGGNPDAIGSTVAINGEAYTVVGVMPAGFGFPTAAAQFWIPMAEAGRGTGAWNYEVVGRVAPDLTVRQASDRLGARTVREALEEGREREIGAELVRLQDRLVGDTRPLLLIFMAAVTAVLLIACVNVVNLMLTRATAREHEHTVRAALGAGPRRMAQQLLTESTVVSFLGACFGLLVAFVLADVLVALAPDAIPRREQIHLDHTAFLFTLGVAAITGLGIGILPAARALKMDLVEHLNRGTRGISGSERLGWIRDGLAVVQIGLSLVLLVAAGLLTRSFAGLLAVEQGFDGSNVLTFETSLPQSSYPGFAEAQRFYDELIAGVRALPGVESAALVTYLPSSGWFHSTGFELGSREADSGELPDAEFKQIGPDYFTTMGISLVAGRAFTEADDLTAPGVAIIDESTARRYLGRVDPIGETIRFDDQWCRIVGVVADVRYRVSREAPRIYVPYAAGSRRGSMDVVLRVQDLRANLAGSIRELVSSIDPGVTLYGVRPLEDILWTAVAEPRFRTLLVAAFAALSLVLSTVGVFGVMAYSVAQRTREMGIRLALGAHRGRIVWTVVSRGGALTVAGVFAGAVGAFATVGVLRGFLVDVAPRDPGTFLIAGGVLALVSMLACCIPALRATRVDPLIALRTE